MAAFHQVRAQVLAQHQLAQDTFLLRLQTPEIARAIEPGQFVMLRLLNRSDPLLGRPFALYDVVLEAGAPVGIDIVYLVVGKATRLLAQLVAGDELDVWGPLGQRFPEPLGSKLIALVAGGIGQTPFLAHIRELLGHRGYAGSPPRRRVDRVSLYYGVRNAAFAAGVADFQKAGAEIHIASNDGSIGYSGFVTQLLENHDAPEHLFGCGPEPMLHALAQQALRREIPCHVSLESPMACGVGICFSCVTPVITPTGWDYKRVCVEGPIFDAQRLCWTQ